MRNKYPAVVLGCIVHAIALTGCVYWYGHSGPGGASPSPGSQIIALLFILFSLIWFLWAIALWYFAPKPKMEAAIIPLIVGLFIMSPVLLMDYLWVLVIFFDIQPFRQ